MSQSHYPDAPSSPEFSSLEQSVLAVWQAQQTFEQSVKNRPSTLGGAKNEYVFYDGPPFANGLPHYGHLLTGYVKDVFARYHTMKGKRVERRFGWDCHGLPAEMGAEKELGISGRQAIQTYGIAKFNDYCRTSVMKYAGEWEEYVNRQARWVDFGNDYKTMNRDYMESVLWAFKQLYDKGLVYESYRVMPYSWAAETPLSNFETKLDNSYRSRTDKAVTVAFELKSKPHRCPKADKYYILAWTTTPWTLPSNLALAVRSDMDYVCATRERKGVHPDSGIYRLFKNEEQEICFILSDGVKGTANYIHWSEQVGTDIKPTYDQKIKGTDLIGLTYEPLFPYFADHPNAFRILDGSDFIEEGSGTGVVHMAPGFGEDDQRVCKANGIDVVVPVDEQGKYTDEIVDIPFIRHPGEGRDPAGAGMDSGLRRNDEMLSLRGLNVIADTRKSADEPYSDDQLAKYGLANLRIIAWLKANDRLVKQDDYAHNYPHCWRTDTPIIYRAMSSWYVAVTKFRDRAVELNRNINWIPSHIRDGQMEHMLATAPDWSISRNRFWGTPIPIWKSDNPDNEQLYVFGSIKELEDFFAPHMKSPHPNPLPEGEGTSAARGEGAFKVHDLHRPYIDALTAPDPTNPHYTLRRVTDVFDCWFESGSMPFAQVHYPFENKDWFETHFPADFITEYVGQTRGWFNTLIMLSTALFDKEPFKNCICHGVVIDEETGLKYSKRLKNYKDPMEVFDKFGADALRWLMMSSPVMRGADLAIDPEGKFIHDAIRLYIKPIWNAYYFFTLYANADGVKARLLSSCGTHSVSAGSAGDSAQANASQNDNENLSLMDRYILAKCAGAVTSIQTALDAYDSPAACQAVTEFVEVLNNWYIRRNKDRFWGDAQSPDKQAAYDTLYTVLHILSRAVAPLLPMVSEAVYQGLNGSSSCGTQSVSAGSAGDSAQADASQNDKNLSVHLADWPEDDLFATPEEYDTWSEEQKYDYAESVGLDEYDLIRAMDKVRDICNAGLAVRNDLNIRVRQPLSEIAVYLMSEQDEQLLMPYVDLIRDELNVHNVVFSFNLKDKAEYKLLLNFSVLGKRVGAKMKDIAAAAKKGEWSLYNELVPDEKYVIDSLGSAQLTFMQVKIVDEVLECNEFEIKLEPKAGIKGAAPLSSNDALVILDLTITPELEAEGLARDLVRMIQQARKDAGLHVSDRINLRLDVPEAAGAAVETHKDYIAQQVLAVSLVRDNAKSAKHHSEQQLDGQSIVIGFEVAA